MPTVSAGVLHHTAGKNGYSRAQVPGIIRGDFAYHLSRGWNDIGYNVLVDRFGRAWEGRGGGLDKAILGAHTGGFNTDTFGVSVLGNLDVARPSAATVEAIARVMAWKLDAHHRDPLGSTVLTARGADGTTSRYKDGTRVRMPTILGHRNVGQTACPGKYLYPYLPAIRRRAAAIMKAGLLEPRLSAAERVYRGGGATVSAAVAGRPELAAAGARGVLRPARGVGERALEGADAVLRRLVGPGRRRGVGAAGPVRPRADGVLEGRTRAVVHAVRAGRAAGPARPADRRDGDRRRHLRADRAVHAARHPDVGVGGKKDGGTSPLGPDGRVDLRVLGRGGIPASGVTSVVVETVSVCATRNTALTVFPTGRAAWGTQSRAPAGAGHAVGDRRRPGRRRRPGQRAQRPRRERRHRRRPRLPHVRRDGRRRPRAGPGPALRLAHLRRRDARPARRGRSRCRTSAASRRPPTRAHLLDVTVVEPVRTGMLQVFGGTSASGVAARLHYPPGAAYDERMPVAVSGGKLTLRASGPVHVLIDTAGYYPAAPGSGLAFTAVAPVRLVDTRTSGSGYLSQGAARSIRVTGVGGVPADAKAVLVNVVGIQPHGDDAPHRLADGPGRRGGDRAAAGAGRRPRQPGPGAGRQQRRHPGRGAGRRVEGRRRPRRLVPIASASHAGGRR